MYNTLKILTVSGIISFTAACGGGAENSQEKAIEKKAEKYGIDADVSVNENGDVEKITINQGNAQIGQNLNLPDSFPADISLPSDWNIMASTPVPNGFSVQAISNEDADAIFTALRNTMTNNGWIESASDQANVHMSRINFTKSNRVTNFNVIANGETNMVQVMTMVQP